MLDNIMRELDRNQKFYFTIAYRYLHDLQDAQDAVQNTFFRAYRHIPPKLPSKKLRGWLVVLCCNEARRLLSRRKHLALSDDLLSAQSEPVSAEGDPQALEFYYEDITYAAVKLAPKDYQQALCEYYIEGESLLYVAKKYNVAESSLRYWRKKVETKLKEFL